MCFCGPGRRVISRFTNRRSTLQSDDRLCNQPLVTSNLGVPGLSGCKEFTPWGAGEGPGFGLGQLLWQKFYSRKDLDTTKSSTAWVLGVRD